VKLRKTDSNALRIEIPTGPGQEHWFLLRSDAHHDNPHCQREMEKKHLEEALELNAGIIDVGDLFCAMQGKYDPRSSKTNLRPEHQRDDYLDALISTTADDYADYAKNWITMSPGNHEAAIKKRHETDLTQRLVAVLNDRTGSNIQCMGYTGWIRFVFAYGKNKSVSKTLWYTHGSGGGSPVTHGIIASARQNVYIENADIMVSGHVHRSWVQEYIKTRLTNIGQIVRRICFYVKTPTYKDAYADGQAGFEVETGHGPRPLGAYWLKFTTRGKSGGCDVEVQVIKAG
jgi:hypothetical protein